MLTPRLTNCPECADIPNLLKKIDCKLAEYANGLYNNVVFMLNQVVPAGAMIQLLAYKRILTYKQCNPDYLSDFYMNRIVGKVTTLTLGSNIKPTVTETLIPATTSTTSTSTTCPPLICSFDGTGVSSCSFTGTVHKVTITPTTTSTTSATPTTSTTSTTSSTTTSTSSTTTTTTTNPCPNCISGTEIPIETQTWATCNLNVETYSDGTIIPQVTNPTEWASLTTGAWCYYNNDSANGPIYGRLYNFYAVAGIDGSGTPRTLAPVGYHVPSKSEFDTLVTYLGGESLAGGKMKEPNLCHWSTPNILLTPYSGFAALPGGYRNNVTGTFQTLGTEGAWWSSSESSTNPTQNGLSIILSYNDTTVFNTQDTKQRGFSVRLIKD